MPTIIEIKPKSPRTRWVALSLDKKAEIISEGVKPEVVIRKANSTGKKYIVQFIPNPNSTYIL
jgi:hypothetical protein